MSPTGEMTVEKKGKERTSGMKIAKDITQLIGNTPLV